MRETAPEVNADAEFSHSPCAIECPKSALLLLLNDWSAVVNTRLPISASTALLVLDDNQSVVEHPPKTRVADNRSVFVFIYTKVTAVYARSITYKQISCL